MNNYPKPKVNTFGICSSVFHWLRANILSQFIYTAEQKSAPKLSLKDQRSLICPGYCSSVRLSSSLPFMMAGRTKAGRCVSKMVHGTGCWMGAQLDYWREPQWWSPQVARVGFSQHGGYVLRGSILKVKVSRGQAPQCKYLSNFCLYHSCLYLIG